MSQTRNTPRLPSPRRHARAAAAALGIALVAACSAEGPTTPNASAGPRAATFAKGPAGAKKTDKDLAKQLTQAEFELQRAVFRTTAADVESGVDRPEPLACGFRGTYVVSQRIGRGGGQLVLGRSRLVVPAGALAGDVQVTAKLTLGEQVTAEFSPHGLKFAKPAELRVNYSGCAAPAAYSLNVYYTNEAGGIVQTMPSADQRSGSEIRSLTDHFSGYVVAWGRKSTR